MMQQVFQHSTRVHNARHAHEMVRSSRETTKQNLLKGSFRDLDRSEVRLPFVNRLKLGHKPNQASSPGSGMPIV